MLPTGRMFKSHDAPYNVHRNYNVGTDTAVMYVPLCGLQKRKGYYYSRDWCILSLFMGHESGGSIDCMRCQVGYGLAVTKCLSLSSLI